MRRLVVSIDAHGRSCAVSEHEVELHWADGHPAGVGMIHATESCPPTASGGGHAPYVDYGVAPGLLRWTIAEYPPGASAPLHRTGAIQLVLVVEGSIELRLDDGAHPLFAGDCVVLDGVDHAWEAGPDGCRMSTIAVGTAEIGSGPTEER